MKKENQPNDFEAQDDEPGICSQNGCNEIAGLGFKSCAGCRARFRALRAEKLATDAGAWRAKRSAEVKASRKRHWERIRRKRREPEELMKARAQRAVSRAVASGRLIRPETCSDCRRGGILIHGHHHDYSLPLDVLWLCASCHTALHARLDAAERLRQG